MNGKTSSTASQMEVSDESKEFGRKMRTYRKRALVPPEDFASAACMQLKNIIAVEEGRAEMSGEKKTMLLNFFPEIDTVEL